MSWIGQAFSSSIGKKQLMALTGLALCGFLATHLAGNFLVFLGAETFDAYAAGLEERKWLLIPAEIVLIIIFSAHLYLAAILTIENRRARGSRYAVSATRGEMTFASATMPISGVFILVFLVLHLIHFKFGERPVVAVGGEARESLYWLEVQTFQDPVYLVWYVVAVCVVGVHVYHGLQSSLRTLGMHDSRCDSLVRNLGRAFGALVAIGYAVIPIYLYLFVSMPEAP